MFRVSHLIAAATGQTLRTSRLSWKAACGVFALLLVAGCTGDLSSDNQASDAQSDAADATHSDTLDTNPTSDADALASDGGEVCEEDFPSADEVSEGHETLVAVQTLEPPVVDGSLDDAAYGQAASVEFIDPLGESDNRMIVRSVWEGDWFYVGVQVFDESLEGDTSLPIHVRDGIELMLDPDNDRGTGLLKDHHILISATGAIHTERYTASGDEPATNLGEQLATAEVDGGYIIEFAAPASALDFEPTDALRMGLLLVNNDRDAGEHRAFTWTDSDDWKNPSTYGEVYLAAKSCIDTEGDAGPDASHADADTGHDADAEPDAGDEGCTENSDFEPLAYAGPAVIGGGPDYPDKVCRDQADVVVSTLSELENALGQANSGDVVFIDPDARIDMGFDAELRVPSGVTLSGGRGCDCRAGALLYTDDIVKTDHDNETVLNADANARVTGLRVRGPHPKGDWIRAHEQDHYLDGEGIDIDGADVEIDNNEVWGFANAGISGGLRSHIHHNHLHNMPREGLGYGINGGDNLIIEYNYFDWVRHAVASSGRRSYEARYNYMGENAISHVFDMHKDGGKTMLIHHNTIAAVDNAIKNKNVPGVLVRGVPSDTADIHHNWFFNPKEPRSSPNDNWTDEAIVQKWVTSWTNVSFWDNHYGSSDPGDCSIGAPREGCPLP